MRRLAPLLLACLPDFAAAETEVDLELFLAVDVSRSMTPRELEIQRRGYAEALVSREVVSAIERGLLGRIALTYVEWAGAASQRVVVDWTLIESRADAEAFAEKITAHFEDAMRRTSISGAIDYATWAFDENGFQGLRRVIDISGDGPNNQGRTVTDARDEALAAGIVINGLPLMTKEGRGWAPSGIWTIWTSITAPALSAGRRPSSCRFWTGRIFQQPSGASWCRNLRRRRLSRGLRTFISHKGPPMIA